MWYFQKWGTHPYPGSRQSHNANAVHLFNGHLGTEIGGDDNGT